LDGIINKIGDLDGDAIAGKLTGFLDKASGYWNVLKTEALEVKTALEMLFRNRRRSRKDHRCVWIHGKH